MKIPFESKLSLSKTLMDVNDIEERNKLFDNLSDRDKRKEIAYDGLMLILSGIVHGSFLRYWDDNLENLVSELRRDKKEELPKEFQKKLINELPYCKVCQRGLVMLSTIRLGNKINPYEEDYNKGGPSLVKGFDMVSMLFMETEYEGLHEDICKLPYKNNTTEKLANICCNIIANGDFLENDTTDYLEKWEINIKTKHIDEKHKKPYS